MMGRCQGRLLPDAADRHSSSNESWEKETVQYEQEGSQVLLFRRKVPGRCKDMGQLSMRSSVEAVDAVIVGGGPAGLAATEMRLYEKGLRIFSYSGAGLIWAVHLRQCICKRVCFGPLA